jgi:hypothetical protein
MSLTSADRRDPERKVGQGRAAASAGWCGPQPKARTRACRGEPLTHLERVQPTGKGEVKGNARRSFPRSQSGKNRHGKS